jgi:hypothetical protein
MTFEEVLDQAMAMLQRRGRVTYRTLQRALGCPAERRVSAGWPPG